MKVDIKKGFRVLALAMLMLMLRYTLLPHQFMAYAHCENIFITLQQTQPSPQLDVPGHRDLEAVYVVEHPEQFVINQFVLENHLEPHSLAPVDLTLATPLSGWHSAENALDRAPPTPLPLSLAVHIPSTRLLI